MSYTFPKGVDDGHEVTLATGVVYVYSESKNRWDVKEVASDEHSHDDYATDGELEALAERVGHLETTVADHRFTVDTGVPSDGGITPLFPGGEDMLWENVTGLSVAKVDADGRAVSMEQVYPGIAIRLVEHGNSGHFVGTVDSVTDSGTYTLLDVTASHGAGTHVLDDEVVMSVFPPGGEADLSLYVTQDQFLALSDSALVGDASNDATEAFRLRSGDKTFVSLFGDELGLYHVKAPTSPTHVARLQDVTDADYAPKSHSHSYASTNHGHSYASSNHGHDYLSKGSGKKIMQADGTTGPVQFTISGNNLYWNK